MTPRTLPEKDLHKFAEMLAQSAALQVYGNNHCNAADTVEDTSMETSTLLKIKALTVYVMNVSVQRGQTSMRDTPCMRYWRSGGCRRSEQGDYLDRACAHQDMKKLIKNAVWDNTKKEKGMHNHYMKSLLPLAL